MAKWVIIFIIAYFVFLKNFLYSTCPLVILTGFPCPMCGMTRAGFALLRLNFGEAFHIHPFIYPIIFMIVIFCINRYLSAKKDTGVDEMVHDFSSGFYGLILYLENVPLFSGRTTYELLLQQCSQLFFQDFCDKIIS